MDSILWNLAHVNYGLFRICLENLVTFHWKLTKIWSFQSGRVNSQVPSMGKSVLAQYYAFYSIMRLLPSFLRPFSDGLIPAIREQSGKYFVQQNSAPAHRAHETIGMLRRETPAFMAAWVWPLNSPDLNPVDYRIWGVLQDRVYQTKIRDTEYLKERLVEEWSRFNQSIIDGAVSQWRACLRACVPAEGGHFECKLWCVDTTNNRLFSEPPKFAKEIKVSLLGQLTFEKLIIVNKKYNIWCRTIKHTPSCCVFPYWELDCWPYHFENFIYLSFLNEMWPNFPYISEIGPS